eukprot:9118722-Pyramimonas_sp.AAC.1
MITQSILVGGAPGCDTPHERPACQVPRSFLLARRPDRREAVEGQGRARGLPPLRLLYRDVLGGGAEQPRGPDLGRA